MKSFSSPIRGGFNSMLKKYPKRTFSDLCLESPLLKQGINDDSLQTHGCWQGAIETFAQKQRGFASTLLIIFP